MALDELARLIETARPPRADRLVGDFLLAGDLLGPLAGGSLGLSELPLGVRQFLGLVGWELGLARLGHSIARSFRDPQFRALLLLYGALLLIGTVFYVRAEGWSVLDALYFCVVTLATVGYGDFTFRGEPARMSDSMSAGPQV